MIGIYAIKNESNGKLYIGRSKDINKRIYAHMISLKGGKHPNKEMQSDYDKFGKDVFKGILLCMCGEDKLSQNELIHVRKYDYRSLYNKHLRNMNKDYFVNMNPETYASLRKIGREELNTSSISSIIKYLVEDYGKYRKTN